MNRYKVSIKADLYMAAEKKQYIREEIEDLIRTIEMESIGNYSINVKKIDIKANKLPF